MVSIPYALIRELFGAHGIVFHWRNAPGSEEKAVLHMLPDVCIEPYSLYISSGTIWSMGAFSYSQSDLPAESVVGRYCSFSNGIKVFHSEHPTSWVSTSPFAYNPAAAPTFGLALERAGKAASFAPYPYDDNSTAPLHIGNDVWIGQNVQLKRGIRIGDGAVVAAGAVVTGDVEPFCIVGGVPARVIRMRFADAVIERMRARAWWSYHFADFHELDVREPSVFLDRLEERIDRGGISPYAPQPITLDAIRSQLGRVARPDLG